MKMILLSALFAVGVGLTGMGGASASVGGSALNNAANASSILDEVQYGYRNRRHCRSVTVCRRGPYGRRCHVERVCRR